MRDRFTHREIADFCREMALMLHAGIGAAEALDLLQNEVQTSHWRSVLSKAAGLADGGTPFSETIGTEDGFPAYMIGLIKVGERTGNLEEAMSALADYYEERDRLNERIRSALLYPAALFLLMMIVIVVLLTQVLPMFRSVYASLGGEMTGIAGALLRVGLGLDAILPALCILLGILLVLLLAFSVSGGVREWVLRMWRTHAGDRGVMRAMNDACFAQAVSMGLSSGLSAAEAMELAAQVLDDVPAARQRCMDCKERMDEGESFVDALHTAGLFPPAARRLLALGVQSGSGDTTMKEIARRLSEDADLALSKKVSRVEPVLVLVCSVLVGAVLLSVMLPLIDIMGMIG